jgi:hypothetical protein
MHTVSEDVVRAVRLKTDVAWCAVGDEIVTLDVAGGGYVAIEGSGPVLWPLVVRGTTEAELVDDLLGRFAIEPERARTDVKAFVETLRTLRLLEDSS